MWYTDISQVKDKYIFSMCRKLPLYLCPNTELLLCNARWHDQIKSQHSSADFHLTCLFLELYYNSNKIMINNDHSSHYLVAVTTEYLKAFVSYLHRELHSHLCTQMEATHQLFRLSIVYLIGLGSNTDLIMSALPPTFSCYDFSSVYLL